MRGGEPLFSSPSSLFGGPSCLGNNGRTMAAMLGKIYRPIAMASCLAKTTAFLPLYMLHLSGRLQNNAGDSSLLGELQSAFVCLASVFKEQAVASGCSLAQFWIARSHLWLSQSQLQQADREHFLRLPVEPTAMFGHQTTTSLHRHRTAVAVRRRCLDLLADMPSVLGALGHPCLNQRLPWGLQLRAD